MQRNRCRKLWCNLHFQDTLKHPRSYGPMATLTVATKPPKSPKLHCYANPPQQMNCRNTIVGQRWSGPCGQKGVLRKRHLTKHCLVPESPLFPCLVSVFIIDLLVFISCFLVVLERQQGHPRQCAAFGSMADAGPLSLGAVARIHDAP